MRFKALLLTPQRHSCHVVNTTSVASANNSLFQYRVRRTSFHLTLPHLRVACRSITTEAHSIPSKVLKNIRDHTQAHPVSIFHSRSDNPYHNLAIENYILRSSDPQSKILLFYTNRPCVVIGRNQNPWLECNIARIQDGLPREDAKVDIDGEHDHAAKISQTTSSLPLDLVRRRSGGGTVIHDVGNLNFSFLIPNDKDFSRDKHGELVVQSLKALKKRKEFAQSSLYNSVRVNDRHDIVMVRKGDMTGKEYKVSGSAFKLTRGRALHHGTILHSSPNVHRQIPVPQDHSETVMTGVFSALLSSPAKPYLEAKGVGSVRSPVHNLFQLESHQQRVEIVTKLREEIGRLFLDTYDAKDILIESVGDEDCSEQVNENIYQDVQELMTDNWRYCQTPTFEYNSHRSAAPLSLQFQVKHGIIKNTMIGGNSSSPKESQSRFSELEDKRIHEVQSWAKYLPPSAEGESDEALAHLKSIFPKIDLAGDDTQQKVDHEIIEDIRPRNTDGAGITKRVSGSGQVEVEEKGENILVEYQNSRRH